MRQVIDEVLSGFPGDLPFSGREPDDYHVHAASVSAHADYLLTNNTAVDFTATPEEEPYEIIHPDEFYMLVTQSAPQRVLSTVIDAQNKYWASKPRYRQLDEALREADCPQFAEVVRDRLRMMAR